MNDEIKSNYPLVNITHPDKVLFPKSNITKNQLIRYYLDIAKIMLGYLKERPLTMQRFPNGISKSGFFYKNASAFFPNWIQKIRLPKKDGIVNYVIAKHIEDILYLVNLNTITFHVGLSKIKQINFPDILVLDLDPEDVDFSVIKWTAQKIKEITDSLEIPLFVKATGSRGLHLHIPLDGTASFNETHKFAKKLAAYSANCYPNLLTVHPQKSKRAGRVFIDYIRNSYGQTVVAPYSVRAKEGAPIAIPLEWTDLNESLICSDFFNITNVFDRLKKKSDAWSNISKYSCSCQKANTKIS